MAENPIHKAQRKFAEKPPQTWVKIADKIADRGYAKADRKRDRQAQKGR